MPIFKSMSESRSHDSQTYISISQGRWLSPQEYNSKCDSNKKYDFCSYLCCDGDNKDKICGIIATRICRLETSDSTRFRCEECPLYAEDGYRGYSSCHNTNVRDDMLDLTPTSDSKLGRVSKYLTNGNGMHSRKFWHDFSSLFPCPN